MSDRLRDFNSRLRARLLTRWVPPFEAEPSYGLMARVMARHGHKSFRVFAGDLMLDDGAALIRSCTEALSAIGLGSPDQHASIARWTPTFGEGYVTIAGERLPRRAFSLASRRFCPACLHDSPHHRVWFDLRFFRTCPVHGMRLNDRTPDRAIVYWNRCDLTLGPHDAQLSRHGPVVVPRDDLETYVMRRFGLMPAASPSWLDGMPLLEIVRSIRVLGFLEMGGWREATPKTGTDGFGYEAVQEAGWSILSCGAKAVTALLRRIAKAAPERSFGKKGLFGWLTMYMIANRAELSALADAMDQVTVDLGLDRRGTIDKVPAAPPPFMTPREIAEQFGLRVDTVRTIAARVSASSPRRLDARGLQMLVTRRQVKRVIAYAHGGEIRTRDQVRDTITRPEVAAFLGIPESLVFQLVKAGRLKKYVYSFSCGDEDRFSYPLIDEFLDAVPVAHGGGHPVGAGRFMISDTIPDLAAVLSHTLFDAADFFAAVDAGELKIDWRTGGGRGLRDFRIVLGRQPALHPFTVRALSLRYTRVMERPAGSISQKEACAILEVKPHTVKALTQSGHLKAVAAEGLVDGIDEASVKAFAERWAAGKLYLTILECRANALPRRLGALGVGIFSDVESLEGYSGDTINILVDRREMRRALRLRRDPDETDLVRAAWKRFAKVLGEKGSPFYCARIRDDDSACFVSQREYLPVDVRYVMDAQATFGWAPGRQVYRIEAALTLDGKEGRKRVEATGEVLADRDCRGIGVDLKVDRAAGTCSATIVATVVCMQGVALDLAELMDRYLDDDAQLIHRMLLLIRLAFEVGLPYQSGMYGRWPAAFYRDAC